MLGMRAVWLLALVTACSGPWSSRRKQDVWPPIVLDPDAPLPVSGECTWPGRVASADGAIPAELAPQLEGLEVVELRGDLRLSTAETDRPIPTAWSWDGRWLAIGEPSGVFVWETATGALRAVVPLVPRRNVQAVALSAEGEQLAFLASADEDPFARRQSLFVGSVADPRRLRRFDSSRSEKQLRFSSDDTRVLTSHTVLDLASGRRVVAKATPYSSQILPDGVRLVDRPLARGKRAVELRELSTGRVLRSFPVDPAARWSVSDDGSHLMIAGKAGIDVHALDNGRRVRRFPELAIPAPPGSRNIEQALLSPDGSRLLISRRRRLPKLSDTEMWGVQSGRSLWQAYLGYQQTWRFSADGMYLLPRFGPSGGVFRADDGTRLHVSQRVVELSPDSRWQLLEPARRRSGQPYWPDLAPVDPDAGDLGIARAGWIAGRSRDGTYTASIGIGGQLQLESELGCIALGISMSLSATPRMSDTATFSADGRFLLVAQRSTSTAYAWRTTDGTAVHAVKGSGTNVELVADTGQVIFSRYRMRRGLPERRVFDLMGGHEVHYPAPPEPVLDPYSYFFGRQVAATHDGRQLYIATRAEIELVDLEDPSRNAVLHPRAAVVSISPDDRLAATATGRRVNVRTRIDWRSQIDVLHEQRVTRLAFSADGNHLASADEGGLVIVTRTLDGKRLARLRVPHDRVKHLWLSPDGAELAVDTTRGLRVRARLVVPAPGGTP